MQTAEHAIRSDGAPAMSNDKPSMNPAAPDADPGAATAIAALTCNSILFIK